MKTVQPHAALSACKATTYDHLKASLVQHLLDNSYRILDDEEKGYFVLATKRGRREIIEVRGYFVKEALHKRNASSAMPAACASQTIAGAVLQSFINVGTYFGGTKNIVSIALPDTVSYRRIMESLYPYFTENNISRKLYLVDEQGAVTVTNLNQQRNKK